MTTIDKSGTNIEEIISAFRKEYSIRDWELKYDILKKPSNGFLGLFASKTALVRFQLPGVDDRATLFTKTLLAKMGLSYDKILTKLEGKTLYLEIVGCKDPGFLIGKNGTMLETIQFMLNRIFEFDRKIEKIYLDADGYRERREAMFIRQFMPLISKIKVHGKPLTLEPMSAGERRIIHRHVERDKGLRTLTIGEGEMKRIVIFSAKQSEREVLSQSKGEATDKSTAAAEAEKPGKDKPKRPNRPNRPPKPAPEAKPAGKPAPPKKQSSHTLRPNLHKPKAANEDKE